MAGIPVGVGPIRAAIGAFAALQAARPASVVLVGSTGAYDVLLPIGGAVVVRRVGWELGIADLGLGYVPLPPEPLTSDPALRARLSLPEVDALTVGAITTDPALAGLRGANWQVEHMEAYAVAAACAALHIPFVAVLGISNRVGPHAHAEWLAHRVQAEEAACSAVCAAWPALAQVPASDADAG